MESTASQEGRRRIMIVQVSTGIKYGRLSEFLEDRQMASAEQEDAFVRELNMISRQILDSEENGFSYPTIYRYPKLEKMSNEAWFDAWKAWFEHLPSAEFETLATVRFIWR